MRLLTRLAAVIVTLAAWSHIDAAEITTAWELSPDAPEEFQAAWGKVLAEKSRTVEEAEQSLARMQQMLVQQQRDLVRERDRDRKPPLLHKVQQARAAIAEQKSQLEKTRLPSPPRWPLMAQNTTVGLIGSGVRVTVADVVDGKTVVGRPLYSVAYTVPDRSPVTSGESRAMVGVYSPPVTMYKTREAEFLVIVRGCPSRSAAIGETFTPGGLFIVRPPDIASVEQDGGVRIHGPYTVWESLDPSRYLLPPQPAEQPGRPQPSSTGT